MRRAAAVSAVEVLLAVAQVAPSSPLIPQLQAGFKSHADAMIAVQAADGRFHQARGGKGRARGAR